MVEAYLLDGTGKIRTDDKGNVVRSKMAFLATCFRPDGAPISGYWHVTKHQQLPPWRLKYVPWAGFDLKGGRIAENRNLLVGEAFRRENDAREAHCFCWQDDDVITFSPLVWEALSHQMDVFGADIACGVYFTKDEYPHPLIFDGPDAPAKFVPNEGRRVWGGGMGLTLVKAEVYKRMALELKLPADRNGNPEWYRTEDLTDARIEADGTLYKGCTEDSWFFANAERLGLKTVIDCGRNAFGFHHDLLGEFGPKNQGYPQKQWEQFMNSQPVSWEIGGETVVWNPPKFYGG